MYKVNGRPASIIYLSEGTFVSHDPEHIIISNDFTDDDGCRYEVGLSLKEASALADCLYEMMSALQRARNK
jgi:hypothetical protein